MFLGRIVSLLFLTLYPLHAIVSIAPVELGEEPGVSGKVGVSLSTKRGNSDVDAYKFASRITYDNNRTYLTWMQIAGEYGKASGVKNVQKIYAHLRYIHNISDKYHVYELAAQSEDDEFRLIKDRRLVAAGYRHHFSPTSKFKLFAGVGLLYEYIKFTTSLNPTEHNLRGSLYASAGYEFKKGMKLNFISYLQPKLDDTKDFVTFNMFQLSIKIEKELFLNVNISYNYDAKPAVEVTSRYDFSQDTALVYRF